MGFIRFTMAPIRFKTASVLNGLAAIWFKTASVLNGPAAIWFMTGSVLNGPGFILIASAPGRSRYASRSPPILPLAPLRR